MPEDILAKTASRVSGSQKDRKKISVVGVILTIILAIALILLGERIIFDLNRVVNPVIQKVESSSSVERKISPQYSSALSYEQSSLAPDTKIYYPTKEKGKYLVYKLLIQAAFIIPIFLLMILFYYWVKLRTRQEGWRVVVYAYVIFAFWMLLHLLGETGRYIIDQYKSAAIYIILGVLVIILTPLAVFLQKKFSQS